MRLGELRKVVPERTTIWVEEAETGNHLTANENKFLNDEFDNSEVVSLFPERYRAISATGIKVKVKLESDDQMTCQECLSVCVCADSTLYSMYKNNAEKCPFLKDKNKLSEVVRCKDCDYSIKMDSFGNYRCLVLKEIMRGRDFCSYGILKENEC